MVFKFKISILPIDRKDASYIFEAWSNEFVYINDFRKHK